MKISRLVQTSCLVLCISSFSVARKPATETPAHRQLTGWLAAYDGSNWNAYLKFLKTNFVIPPGRGFQDPDLRDRTGGYDLKKIETETSTKVTALLEERATDDFARLTIEVEPAASHRILKLDVDHIEQPADHQ